MQQKLISNVLINNLSINTFFFLFVFKKNTHYYRYIKSFKEFNLDKKKNILSKFFLFFYFQLFSLADIEFLHIETSNLILKDLINLNTI